MLFFIVVGFHADPNSLKIALAHFEYSIGMLRARYPESDIAIFTDLNIDFEQASGQKFFEKLDRNLWHPFFPGTPTRLGAG
jgi:hypothetical protein